jgi:hypothetical protein
MRFEGLGKFKKSHHQVTSDTSLLKRDIFKCQKWVSSGSKQRFRSNLGIK